MKLTIKTLSDTSIVITANSFDTIGTIKQQIFEKNGIPVEHQTLVSSNIELANEKTVDDYGLIDNDIIKLQMSLSLQKKVFAEGIPRYNYDNRRPQKDDQFLSFANTGAR